MKNQKAKIWRPSPEYRRVRRIARPCIIVELDSAAQREELKRRAAAAEVSMNIYVKEQLFGSKSSPAVDPRNEGG